MKEQTTLNVIHERLYYAEHSENDWQKLTTSDPAIGEVYLDRSDVKTMDAFDKLQKAAIERAEAKMICKYRKLSLALNKMLKKYDEGKGEWNNSVVLLPEIDINEPDEC